VRRRAGLHQRSSSGCTGSIQSRSRAHAPGSIRGR
jgi:hypothetical protein